MRDEIIEAIRALSDEDFNHLAAVAHDIARRLPDSGFKDLGESARVHLGLPDDLVQPPPVPPVAPSANDVTVELKGVTAETKVGRF